MVMTIFVRLHGQIFQWDSPSPRPYTSTDTGRHTMRPTGTGCIVMRHWKCQSTWKIFLLASSILGLGHVSSSDFIVVKRLELKVSEEVTGIYGPLYWGGTNINRWIFILIFVSHRLPLYLICVSLGMKSGRTLLERLRKKGWTFKTQFTHVSTHFWA